MSLPPAFLDELRSRLSLSQVVGRKVMWDARKSNQGKGDFWAPCPFHQEKTASFHVDDRKGYYYCFGCHAKGDAISFVRETENVSFGEAIEILAREAGMPLPERDPQMQERIDERARLAQIMEQAVQFFRLQLKTQAAGDARDYLRRRGLTEAAQERWEIGFAPAGWQALGDALRAKGVSDADLLAVGLTKASDKGRAPYDTFRNRIMFPIRDVRGRAIAFGGRAMDPSDGAKYLNSPETVLFDKGRSLFNHARAREASGKGQPLIVAEGYMDVIALSEAGFTATVAPLGTAVTEDQLRLMWRMSGEPIIALDGDKAGIRAAMRVIDLALPMLEAGQSLRFAMLPEGMDPDDLLRAKGRAAMQEVVDAAQPMVRLLWQRETEGGNYDSPERRAALDRTLREKVRLIRDPSIRSHYVEAINALRGALFGRGSGQGRGTWRGPRNPAPAVLTTTRGSALASGAMDADRLREAVILATLVANPAAVDDFTSEIERLECFDADHAAIRDALLRHQADDMRAAIDAELGPAVLEKLFAQNHVAITPAVRRPGNREVTNLCLAEEFAKLSAHRALVRERAEAELDFGDLADEGITWRLGQATQAVTRADRGDSEDRTEYLVGVNGAHVKKEEKSAFDELLGQIDFSKGRHRQRH